jgi:hypothetical protein
MKAIVDCDIHGSSDLFQIIVPAFNEQSILETTLRHAKANGYPTEGIGKRLAQENEGGTASCTRRAS